MVRELRALPLDGVDEMSEFTIQVGNVELRFHNGFLYSTKPVKVLNVNGVDLFAADVEVSQEQIDELADASDESHDSSSDESGNDSDTGSSIRRRTRKTESVVE